MGLSPARRIILDRRSPRRRELALSAGWDLLVCPPPDDTEDTAPPRQPKESLEDYVVRLARAKALCVSQKGIHGIVLACDTLSEVDGRALGQAANREQAREMLESLSGRRHRVVTGVCLHSVPDNVSLTSSDESDLEMDPLNETFLQWYLESGLWQGKAGACGFQDSKLPLRLVRGSATNVVGLPLELITRMLTELDAQRHRTT